MQRDLVFGKLHEKKLNQDDKSHDIIKGFYMTTNTTLAMWTFKVQQKETVRIKKYKTKNTKKFKSHLHNFVKQKEKKIKLIKYISGIL